MARIRTIKPEFWVSEQIAECSTNARLTFIGLWTFCDDNGVHPARPKTLKAELFPMDDLSAADVADWIGELVKAGLVAIFETEDGERYWHVTGWARHQKIDRPSAKYPLPPHQDSLTPQRAIADHSSSARRAPPPGEEGKGEEGKGEEGRNDSPTQRRIAPAADGSASTIRGARLPADWVLTEDWRAYCVEKRPDLDPAVVAENFRDYWHGKTGRDALKADWRATWQRWVRAERQGPAGASRGAGTAQPGWARAAGFATVFDAETAGCGPGNYRDFRNGQKVPA